MVDMKFPKVDTTTILWTVYLSLLTVLLPHTAWAFDRFEPAGGLRLLGTSLTAWLAAIAFEAAIAVLTHRLATHIESTPRYTSGHIKWRQLQYRYLNAYAFGLLITVGVSAFANLAHAVQFGDGLAIAPKGTLIYAIYLVAFGAILPFASLLFARVLSRAVDEIQGDSPELQAMKDRLKQASKDLQDARGELQTVKDTARGEVSRLTGEVKKLEADLQRAQLQPTIPQPVNQYYVDLLRSFDTNETLAAIAARHGKSEATVSRDKSKLNGSGS